MENKMPVKGRKFRNVFNAKTKKWEIFSGWNTINNQFKKGIPISENKPFKEGR